VEIALVIPKYHIVLIQKQKERQSIIGRIVRKGIPERVDSDAN
jgi:hypothetical protein